MESKLDKIFHHVAFTTFWGLVLGLLVITVLQINQWENNMINICIQKDHTYNECIMPR